MNRKNKIQYCCLTPWQSNPQITTSPLSKLSRTLSRMQIQQKSKHKIKSRFAQTRTKNFPLLKLNFSTQIPNIQQTDQQQSLTESFQHPSSFYIRKFANSVDKDKYSQSRSIVKHRYLSRQNSNKNIRNGRSVMVCDLNKTTDLEIKEVSPWIKFQLNKSRNAFRLKKINSYKIKMRGGNK